MKIAYVVPTLGVGGVELIVKTLADKLKSQGHEVLIFTLNSENIKGVPNIFFEYECVDLEFKNFLYLFKSIFCLVYTLSLKKIEIIHSNTVKANIICRLAKYFKEFKLICSEHHTIQHQTKISFLEKYLFRLNIKSCNLITNVSDEAVDSYINKKLIKKGEMISFYNGIDLNKFKFSEDNRRILRKQLCIDDDIFCFFAVGRLCVQKNFINLLLAYSSLNTNVKTKLFIIGEGSERKNIEKFIADNKIADNVILLGAKKDVHRYYSAFDCFVLSSDFEGLPTVLIEAIASSRISIATDCGGVKEILKYSPELIVPVNCKDSLKNAMQLVLSESYNNRVKIHKNLDFVYNSFSSNSMYQNWFSVYRNLSDNV